MADSTPDTKRHIDAVQHYFDEFITYLVEQCNVHDESKLQSPEKEILDVFTERLFGITYGSDVYEACLADMRPMLDHHYAANRHHPEHFPDGVNDMDLLDIVEMLLDWKAATMRHADGDIVKSLEINQIRFGLSDQLYKVMLNTARRMGWTGEQNDARL